MQHVSFNLFSDCDCEILLFKNSVVLACRSNLLSRNISSFVLFQASSDINGFISNSEGSGYIDRTCVFIKSILLIKYYKWYMLYSHILKHYLTVHSIEPLKN